MRFPPISAAALVACLAVAPAFAEQKAKPHKPAKTSTAKSKGPKTHTAKAATAKTNTAHAKTAKPTTAKHNTAGDPLPVPIARRPEVASRISGMLPPNMSLANARSGFRNDGQFVAALHASRNLNIPFVTLKDAMTGSNPVSLGQAIHVLRPSVDATAEANRAEMQATSDLRR